MFEVDASFHSFKVLFPHFKIEKSSVLNHKTYDSIWVFSPRYLRENTCPVTLKYAHNLARPFTRGGHRRSIPAPHAVLATPNISLSNIHTKEKEKFLFRSISENSNALLLFGIKLSSPIGLLSERIKRCYRLHYSANQVLLSFHFLIMPFPAVLVLDLLLVLLQWGTFRFCEISHRCLIFFSLLSSIVRVLKQLFYSISLKSR